jgi:hypothetical protein
MDADGVWQEDPSADLGRIARQQDLLRRVLDHASGTGALRPEMIGALYTTYRDDLIVDVGLTLDTMIELCTGNWSHGSRRHSRLSGRGDGYEHRRIICARLAQGFGKHAIYPRHLSRNRTVGWDAGDSYRRCSTVERSENSDRSRPGSELLMVDACILQLPQL